VNAYWITPDGNTPLDAIVFVIVTVSSNSKLTVKSYASGLLFATVLLSTAIFINLGWFLPSTQYTFWISSFS